MDVNWKVKGERVHGTTTEQKAAGERRIHQRKHPETPTAHQDSHLLIIICNYQLRVSKKTWGRLKTLKKKKKICFVELFILMLWL